VNEPVVVVTGAGRGIGRAICRRFAAHGAEVLASARSAEELDETCRIIKADGGNCASHPGDVRSASDMKNLVDVALNRAGRVDMLVNCAGVVAQGSVVELSPEAFELLLDVNVKGVYYGCRSVWPVMKAQRDGVIVNISSVASVDAFEGLGAYGASKAWVNAWSKFLAEEGRPFGIRVFSVAPGAVETRMLRDAYPDFPADEALTPEDVAGIVYALAQPDCRHASGQTVFVRK